MHKTLLNGKNGESYYLHWPEQYKICPYFAWNNSAKLVIVVYR